MGVLGGTFLELVPSKASLTGKQTLGRWAGGRWRAGRASWMRREAVGVHVPGVPVGSCVAGGKHRGGLERFYEPHAQFWFYLQVMKNSSRLLRRECGE